VDEGFTIVKLGGVTCYDFTDERGVSSKVTAIVVPIRVKMSGSELEIAWGCNRGDSCFNESCRYSKPYREKKFEIKL
jgi:hypothetical protein